LRVRDALSKAIFLSLSTKTKTLTGIGFRLGCHDQEGSPLLGYVDKARPREGSVVLARANAGLPARQMKHPTNNFYNCQHR